MSQSIKKQALEFRKELGFSPIQTINFEYICLMKNINLIYKEFHRDSFSGIGVKKNDENFILINNAKAIGHQRYSIAHELYHLFFNKYNIVICDISNLDQNLKEDERSAEIFAINFLVPDDGIRHYLRDEILNIPNKTSLNEIIKLELIFKISHYAMLIKLENMNVITSNFKEELKYGIIKAAENLGFDTSLYKPSYDKRTKIISPYIPLAKKLHSEGKISHGKYEELLRKVDKNFEDILKEEKLLEGMEKSIEL